MANIPQIERQMYLLRLLAFQPQEEGLSVDEIEKLFLDMGIEVSKKTIRRDIENLTFYYYISEETRGRTTYFMADKALLREMSLGINDVMSLYFTREILRAYRGLDLGSAACRLLDELIKRASPSGKAHTEAFEILKVRPEKVLKEENIERKTLQDIREAIKEGKRVSIEYRAFSSGTVTKREFDPYVLEIYDGCYHLIGFCRLRNAVRDLRVARIKSLQDTGERFVRPENFYEEFEKNRFGVLAGGEKIKLEIRFSPSAAKYVKEYEKDRADKMTEYADGSLVFIKETTLTPEIKKWILKYGAQAEVLLPEVLRSELAREAETLALLYAGKKDRE